MNHTSLSALFTSDPTLAVAVIVRMAAAVAAGALGMFPHLDLRVKGLTAMILAAAALPAAAATNRLVVRPSLVPLLAGEAVVGLGLGLVVAVVFAAAAWAGGIVASIAGLSWAEDVNPVEATGDGSAAQLAAWLAVGGFLSAGGHLAIIVGLVDSVGRLPVGSVVDTGFSGLLDVVATMPTAAIELAWSLAVPAVAAVLTFHVAAAICLRSIRFTVGAGLLQAAASLVLLGALLQGAATWTEGFASLAQGPLDRGLTDIAP